ncbi:MAG TPA: DoxX family protein [Usitatibacter sp.]|nr:DoxX family protein [Usitatibacter sp.]
MAHGRTNASFSFAGQEAANRLAWREDMGKLVLRVAVAALILLHGIAKIRHGLGDVATAMARANLPYYVGYLIYVGEVLAPALMIVGLWTRPAAAIVAATMLVALVLGHPREVFLLTDHGGLLLEVQWMFMLGALAVALLGAGRFSLGREYGRWN